MQRVAGMQAVSVLVAVGIMAMAVVVVVLLVLTARSAEVVRFSTGVGRFKQWRLSNSMRVGAPSCRLAYFLAFFFVFGYITPRNNQIAA